MTTEHDEQKQLVAYAEIEVEHAERLIAWIESLGLDPGSVLEGPRSKALSDLLVREVELESALKGCEFLFAVGELGEATRSSGVDATVEPRTMETLKNLIERIRLVIKQIQMARALYGGRS